MPLGPAESKSKGVWVAVLPLLPGAVQGPSAGGGPVAAPTAYPRTVPCLRTVPTVVQPSS